MMLTKILRPVAQVARNATSYAAVRAAVPKYVSFAYAPACRFGTDLEKINKAQQKLSKALETEYKFEKDNYQVDESINDFLKEKGFELIDKPNTTRLELIKNQGEYTITISFSARSPPQQQQDEAQQDPNAQGGATGNQQLEEEQQDYQDYCDFQVFVQGKNGAIVYECSSFDAEINVHSVNTVKDVNTYKNQTAIQRISDEYTGPDFNTLDERLQTAITEFLKSLGVDEEVASFVEHVSLDKEQRLYMGWLEQIKKVVA